MDDKVEEQEVLDYADVLATVIHSDKIWEAVAIYLSTYVGVNIDKVVEYNGNVSMMGTMTVCGYEMDYDTGHDVPIKPLSYPISINISDVFSMDSVDGKSIWVDMIDREVRMEAMTFIVPKSYEPAYKERMKELVARCRTLIKYIIIRHVITLQGCNRQTADKVLREYRIALGGSSDAAHTKPALGQW